MFVAIGDRVNRVKRASFIEIGFLRHLYGKLWRYWYDSPNITRIKCRIFLQKRNLVSRLG